MDYATHSSEYTIWSGERERKREWERGGEGKREEESLFRLKSVSFSRSVRLLCETLVQKIVQSCGQARS